MAVQLLACPLCSQPGFTTLDSLRDGLISAATRQLICPVCHDVLSGLDKFTIHLFSHCTQNNVRCLSLPGHEKAFDQENVKTYPRPVCMTKPLVNQLRPESKPSESVREPFVRNERIVEADRSGMATVLQPSTSTMSNVSACRPKETVSLDAPHVLNVLDSQASELTESRVTAREQTIEEETRCDRCGITFEDPKVLPLHKQLVHPPPVAGDGGGGAAAAERRSFGCFLCSKVFKMRGSLMVHLRVAHGASNVGGGKKTQGGSVGVEERSVVCNACGKTFTKEQHLNQHMKTHEEKQWACDVCQKMFTTKYFLKKHKRLHTGEMPYSCGICHKAFTFQQSMHKHALYHSNDKPHSCPDCNRTFKELSTLANHRRIHTGEKPFSCETCGKCFRQRVSYLVHRRIHTGVMPYQCTACGKSFRYKVSERSHKCPSQPPGVIVRQAGDLLQKLQERAAQHATISQPGGAPSRPGQTADQQLTSAAATSQFIIIVDDLRPSSQSVRLESATDRRTWPGPPDETTFPPSSGWSDPPQFGGSKRSDERATPDFFAVLEDLPSPSDRLKNLTLSPGGGEGGGPGDPPAALQTINEESLKQLLLGFRD